MTRSGEWINRRKKAAEKWVKRKLPQWKKDIGRFGHTIDDIAAQGVTRFKAGSVEAANWAVSVRGDIQDHFDADKQLLKAAATGDVDTIKELVAGPPASIDDLELALIEKRFLKAITTANQVLIGKANVNCCRNPLRETPLFRASQKGHSGAVEVLLTHGADVNCLNKKGKSALLVASEFGDSEIVRMLLVRKAQVNQADRNGKTPLMKAAKNGHRDVVELLLVKGADVNAQSNYGKTALSRAEEERHADVVELLLSHGAHPQQQGRAKRRR